MAGRRRRFGHEPTGRPAALREAGCSVAGAHGKGGPATGKGAELMVGEQQGGAGLGVPALQGRVPPRPTRRRCPRTPVTARERTGGSVVSGAPVTYGGRVVYTLDDRVTNAAAFLAPFPPEDIAARLDEAAHGPPLPAEAPVWRSKNAAAVLAHIDRTVAWRLLVAACECRIKALRSGQERRPEGEPITPWLAILWSNALAFTELAGDAGSGTLRVARALIAGNPWSGTLPELLEAAREIGVDHPAGGRPGRRSRSLVGPCASVNTVKACEGAAT